MIFSICLHSFLLAIFNFVGLFSHFPHLSVADRKMANAHHRSAEQEKDEIDQRSEESDQRSPPPAFPLLCHDTLIDVFRFFDRRALSRAAEPLCARFRALFASGRLFAVYPTKQFEWLILSKSMRPSIQKKVYTATVNMRRCALSLEDPTVARPMPDYLRFAQVSIWLDNIVHAAHDYANVNALDFRRQLELIELFAGTFCDGAILCLNNATKIEDRPTDPAQIAEWRRALQALFAGELFARILPKCRAIRCLGMEVLEQHPSVLLSRLMDANCRILAFKMDNYYSSPPYRWDEERPPYVFTGDPFVQWLNCPLPAELRDKERLLSISLCHFHHADKKQWLDDLNKQLVESFCAARSAQPYTLYIETERGCIYSPAYEVEEVLARNERTGELLTRAKHTQHFWAQKRAPTQTEAPDLYLMLPTARYFTAFSRYRVQCVPQSKCTHWKNLQHNQ